MLYNTNLFLMQVITVDKTASARNVTGDGRGPRGKCGTEVQAGRAAVIERSEVDISRLAGHPFILITPYNRGRNQPLH